MLICQSEALVFFLVTVNRECSQFVTPRGRELCSSLTTITQGLFQGGEGVLSPPLGIDLPPPLAIGFPYI